MGNVVEIALACSAHQLPEDGLHVVVRAVYEERLTFFAELDSSGHGVRLRRIEHELGVFEVSIWSETPAGGVFDASVFFTVCLLV